MRLVEQNAMAFAYRAASAAAATRSLDVQYYIWNDDLTGRLLAAELMRAAERGVRVRVLVDDIDARAKHDLFRVADLHPNIEVRLFNPYYSRTGTLGMLTEWVWRTKRLNRRMHNKAWIADNRVAIVGGRNIGDEYFGASGHSNFSDLDVVLAGPPVADVSAAFDLYWNDPNAVPVSRFEGKPPKPERTRQADAAGARLSAMRPATRPTCRRCATSRRARRCWPSAHRRSPSSACSCWWTTRPRSAPRPTGSARRTCSAGSWR